MGNTCRVRLPTIAKEIIAANVASAISSFLRFLFREYWKNSMVNVVSIANIMSTFIKSPSVAWVFQPTNNCLQLIFHFVHRGQECPRYKPYNLSTTLIPSISSPCLILLDKYITEPTRVDNKQQE